MIEVGLSCGWLHVVGQLKMIPRIEHHALDAGRLLSNELMTGDDGIGRPALRPQVEVPLVVGEEERAVVRAIVE